MSWEIYRKYKATQTCGLFQLPLIFSQIVAIAKFDQQLQYVLAYDTLFLALLHTLLDDVKQAIG